MTTYQANVLDRDVEYNGWTNYETWNVGLWLGGDEGLYDIARRALDYDHLMEMLAGLGSEVTGDGGDGMILRLTPWKLTRCWRICN